MLETGGSLSIKKVPQNVKKIIDFKCPSSGMEQKNLWEIINDISKNDEVKFVIGNRTDFDWAINKIKEYNIENKCLILFSSVFSEIEYQTVVEWMLDSKIKARFQLQIHKHIWEKETKGV